MRYPAGMVLSGLGGAVLGLVGGAWIDKRHTENDQKGAARALYFEALRNAAYLEEMSRRKVPLRPVATSTWTATQARVAVLLPADKFQTVAAAYVMADAERANVEAAVMNGLPTMLEHADGWARNAAEFRDAAKVLRSAGWSERDQEGVPDESQ